MSIHQQSGRRYQSGAWENVTDDLSIEAALQININGDPFTITMRSPGEDEALSRGLLFTEGIINREGAGYEYSDCQAEDDPHTRIADIKIPEIFLCKNFKDTRSLISTSSCGMCGKKDLQSIVQTDRVPPPSHPMDIESLIALPARMRKKQNSFSLTGGCHAAAAFSIEGECLACAEDVGRHNAVDKVVGILIKAGSLDQVSTLQVSGRVSYEIVSKAVRAGIPILSAVSAPSSMAVDWGEALGLSIIGFCREGRGTVYCNPQGAVAQ
jgi:FdhD protein